MPRAATPGIISNDSLKGSLPFFKPILTISSSETTTPVCPRCFFCLYFYSAFISFQMEFQGFLGLPFTVSSHPSVFNVVKGNLSLDSSACCQHGSPCWQEGRFREQGSRELKPGGG